MDSDRLCQCVKYTDGDVSQSTRFAVFIENACKIFRQFARMHPPGFRIGKLAMPAIFQEDALIAVMPRRSPIFQMMTLSDSDSATGATGVRFTVRPLSDYPAPSRSISK